MINEMVPVIVHIQSEIHRGKGEPVEQTDDHRQGQFVFKNNFYYLRYDDPLEGVGETTMTIKFREGEALLIRQGALSMRQHLIDGTTTEGIYQHPLGRMNLKTQTQAIQFKYYEPSAKGSLRLDYRMEMEGHSVGQYTLKLEIKEGTYDGR